MDGGKQKTNPGEGSTDDSPLMLPDAEAMPARAEGIVSRQIAGETILVPTKSTAQELDDIFTLNEVASSVWELIDGRRTVSDISAAIAREYEVSTDQALIDTRELITMFRQADVIDFDQHSG